MSQTDNESGRNGNGAGGAVDGLRSMAAKSPVAEKLLHSVEDYLGARSQKLVGALGDKVSGTTEKLTDVASGKAEPSSLLGNASKKVAEGESPGKAVLKGAVGGVGEKIKNAFGKGKGPSGKKSMNIEEQIDVGVPVRDAYNRWTQFTEFSKWAKGVQSVNQEDPIKSSWNAKIFLSKRNWNAKITEQIADERIAWSSDGPKGTVDGVVTFHPIAPNLTRVILVLEYHPAGLFEKTGNLWRAQGRRARLDLKLYRRFVTMSNDEVEGWRGEIRDGEVVKEHEDALADEENDQTAEDGSEDYDDGEDDGEDESAEYEDDEDEGADDDESAEYDEDEEYDDVDAEDDNEEDDESAEYGDEDDNEGAEDGSDEEDDLEQPRRNRRGRRAS